MLVEIEDYRIKDFINVLVMFSFGIIVILFIICNVGMFCVCTYMYVCVYL